MHIRGIVLLFVFAGLVTYSILSGEVARRVKAGVNLAVSTPVSAVNTCKIKNVCFDYQGNTITVYYGYFNPDNKQIDGGSISVPFPNPTPAILGTIKQGIEKALAGQNAVLGVTPIAQGTVVP